MERYLRNRLYITSKEQEIIKDTPILVGGCGLGSNIAECMLRLGFESITLIDGDKVELSNLNRQNYTEESMGKQKSEQIYERLKNINPQANIKFYSEFVTEKNLDKMLDGISIAINALDFTNDIPLLFDKKCQEKGIFIIHPYNLGWGGLVINISPDGLNFQYLERENEKFSELSVVDYIASYSRFWNNPKEWLEDIITKYKAEKENLSPPQLSIASWIVAGMVTHIAYNIATGKRVKIFPEFYIKSILDE